MGPLYREWTFRSHKIHNVSYPERWLTCIPHGTLMVHDPDHLPTVFPHNRRIMGATSHPTLIVLGRTGHFGPGISTAVIAHTRTARWRSTADDLAIQILHPKETGDPNSHPRLHTVTHKYPPPLGDKRPNSHYMPNTHCRLGPIANYRQ